MEGWRQNKRGTRYGGQDQKSGGGNRNGKGTNRENLRQERGTRHTGDGEDNQNLGGHEDGREEGQHRKETRIKRTGESITKEDCIEVKTITNVNSKTKEAKYNSPVKDRTDQGKTARDEVV